MNWKEKMGTRYLAEHIKNQIENKLYKQGYDAKKDAALVKVLDLIDKDMVEQALESYENENDYWTSEAQLVASSNH
jgi:hypothetical protein